MEAEYEQKMMRIREQFTIKEKELDEIQQRFVPQMDTDVLRLKMLSELEGPHRKELEAKNTLIENQSASLFDLKRKYQDLLETSQSNKNQLEKEVLSLKERSRNETNSLIEEIKKLQDQVEDNKDQEQLRKLRRENENVKNKNSELISEIEDLNTQINDLRSERQTIMWDNNKQLEKERENYRSTKNELESIKYKYNQFEKDRTSIENELTKKRSEVEILMNEEDNLKTHINKLESEVKNLRISEGDLKTKIYKREEEFAKKLSTIENDKKRETERYREEVDTMRDQLNETSRLNTINFTNQDDVEGLRNENSKLREDLKLLETR
mmetsp:Transcript_43971/g.96072  ORF Transcript_43971/g.96072 Transcript_43971/m.96072 type:complete len:325 (+) Transcript_43971:201-1175(+)